MATSRSRLKVKGRKEKGDSFAGIPRTVMAHDDYRESSFSARALLSYFAYQYRGWNNGNLSASYRQLKPWGFGSKSTLTKALRELQARNLVLQTRTGRFQNPGHLCALYALTWCQIDECPGKNLEVGPTNVAPRRF